VNTLLTHVAAGATFSGDITDGMSVPSLAMNTNLDFGVDGATVTVSTPQSVVATVIMPDIEASNGVVHVIDMVLIPAIVAVSDIDGAGFDVEFFPNPVQDRMNVRINDLQIEDMNVSLINMAGQRLSNQVLTNGNNIIEFTTLPAGTYTLEINIDGNIYSKQVLKQ
ncbi:MAG: fasciclin domain-containing protein, partial [Bacteroidota bacterium]